MSNSKQDFTNFSSDLFVDNNEHTSIFLNVFSTHYLFPLSDPGLFLQIWAFVIIYPESVCDMKLDPLGATQSFPHLLLFLGSYLIIE